MVKKSNEGKIEVFENKLNALEEFVRLKEKLKKTTPLRYLFWEATLRCNLSCAHCGSDCVRDDSTEFAELSAEAVQQELVGIAKQYPPQQITFAIIGGEPLVRKDVIDIGAFSAKLGYNWGITTNGMLLSARTVGQLKSARLSTISVSLDGMELEHDTLRRQKGSHDVVVGGIQRLLDDRFWQKFDVICVVSKINVDSLEPFVDEMAALGVPAVRFTPVFSRGRAGNGNDLMLDKAGYLKLMDFLARQRSTRNDIKVYLSEEGYYGPEWECVVRDEFHYCSSGTLIGSILHDGKVTGCPSVSRKYIEGNVKETSFVEIWKNRFSRYREDRQKTFPAECEECEHWVLCEGGGFHLLDQGNLPENFCSLKKVSK